MQTASLQFYALQILKAISKFKSPKILIVIPAPTFVRVNSFRWESTPRKHMDSGLHEGGDGGGNDKRVIIFHEWPNFVISLRFH